MTEMQAAVGLAQLKKINSIVRQKKLIFEQYKKFLNKNVIFQSQIKNTISTYWLVTILVDKNKKKINLEKYLKKNNIETRPIFNPIHKLKMYRNTKNNFKNSEKIYNQGVSLPSYPGLSQKEIKFICDKINRFLK